ncbi:MAG: hypothetical protein EPO63_04310 [Candidatus Nitrosotenuis sp.]|nr:MAG: hypothetical protein EPO63_04310 [Candidatus Nitrosotenuis sp.]
MNDKTKILAILLILPLFTIVLTNLPIDANAEKSKGNNEPGRVGTNSYGAKTAHLICGDKLCYTKPGLSTSSQTQTTKSNVKADTTKHAVTKAEMSGEEYKLKLSRASVPTTIPMHKGWYNGEPVYYIITDSSEQKHADIITEKQGWKVELATPLAKTPKEALSKTYIFTNGVKGDGIHGFQSEIFTSTPGQPDKYSALTSHMHVTWKDGITPSMLDSESAVLQAEKDGKIILTELPVVLNMPQIMWPGGQIPIREDKNINDDTPYVGGQVLSIDTDKMKVTFVAHRGWGPDGRTIYYIVTDATPEMPAAMMAVNNVPNNAKLIASSAAVDLYQFTNGVKGSGPMGFQAGIAGSAPGDQNYSPMWRIFFIGWKDPANASVLENLSDINAIKQQGGITVDLARPMDKDHVVNCPFIDPFQ